MIGIIRVSKIRHLRKLYFKFYTFILYVNTTIDYKQFLKKKKIIEKTCFKFTFTIVLYFSAMYIDDN